MFEGNADVNVPQNPDSAMADSKPNNQNNNIAKINDFHAEAAKILVAMSSSGGAIHTNAEMCTLEHAAIQGALAPSLSPAAGSSAIQTPAAITSDNASNIVASIENDDVEEQTAHISSNATIRASCVPTTLTTSNVRTTYEEAARGIIEHVIMTPERTILSGRVEVVLTATQREKQPAKRTRPDVEIEQEADHNDAMEIDTLDNANATQNENTDTSSMIVVLPATQLCRVQAQAQVGSVSHKTNATDQAENRKPADKDKSKAPAGDQTNDATTMVESVKCTSLQGRALPHDSPPPTHKPSKAPQRAQTTTALHFLQTTANPETAEDLARRAELNNANELARRIGVRPSVRQVSLIIPRNFERRSLRHRLDHSQDLISPLLISRHPSTRLEPLRRERTVIKQLLQDRVPLLPPELLLQLVHTRPSPASTSTLLGATTATAATSLFSLDARIAATSFAVHAWRRIQSIALMDSTGPTTAPRVLASQDPTRVLQDSGGPRSKSSGQSQSQTEEDQLPRYRRRSPRSRRTQLDLVSRT